VHDSRSGFLHYPSRRLSPGLEDPRTAGNLLNFSGRGLKIGVSVQSRTLQPALRCITSRSSHHWRHGSALRAKLKGASEGATYTSFQDQSQLTTTRTPCSRSTRECELVSKDLRSSHQSCNCAGCWVGLLLRVTTPWCARRTPRPNICKDREGCTADCSHLTCDHWMC
jgi:hypothetical protein